MTNQEFIHAIIDNYEQSRKLTIDTNGYEIRRGVSHSISSRSEDLFAKLIATRLGRTDLEFIVDQTMSYRLPGQRAKQFRPDLAIVKGDIITHIFDLKTDIGYNRRYHTSPAFDNQARNFQIFRNREIDKVTYWNRVGNNKEREKKELGVDTNVINQLVIISEKNEGRQSNREDMINHISELDWINIYFLSGGIHPNAYEDEVRDRVMPNDSEFERLFEDTEMRLP